MPETMLGDMPNIMQSPPPKNNTHTQNMLDRTPEGMSEDMPVSEECQKNARILRHVTYSSKKHVAGDAG